MAHFVYVITDATNGKIYVGKCHDPNGRWRSHKWASKRSGRGCILLNNAIRKHGIANFAMRVVGEYETEEEAYAAERTLIARLRSNEREHGYNIDEGGRGGRKLTASTRAKIGKASRARLTPERQRAMTEAAATANTGRKFPERGKKISVALKGRKHTAEHVRNHAASIRGRKLSDETRAKMRAGIAARDPNVELARRKRIAESQTGRVKSKKEKAKLSAALKGKPKSKEHRASLAAAQRRRWARYRAEKEATMTTNPDIQTFSSL
jgi:group I intron endonuclease